MEREEELEAGCVSKLQEDLLSPEATGLSSCHVNWTGGSSRFFSLRCSPETLLWKPHFEAGVIGYNGTSCSSKVGFVGFDRFLSGRWVDYGKCHP